MQIYKTTTRVSELLKHWSASKTPEVNAKYSPAMKWSIDFNGGDNSALALLVKGISSLTHEHSYSFLEQLSLRELDYYLRDNSRESIFNDALQAQATFFEAKKLVSLAIFKSLIALNKKSLGLETLSYQVALDIYSYQNQLAPSSLRLYDFENSEAEKLMIVDFNEELDQKTHHIEKLSGHFIDLFQDDNFNVIPV